MELLDTYVSAASFLNHMSYCSGGLYVIDVINITVEMMTYYKEATGITQYINILEETNLKSKRANLPISNTTLLSIDTCTDNTGRLPVRAFSGNKYVIIDYYCNPN